MRVPPPGPLTPVWMRAAAWMLAAVLLAGSLAAGDLFTTLLASAIGAVAIAAAGPQRIAGRVAAVAGALLLSSLPWAMAFAVRHGELDLAPLAVSLVPFTFGLVLLRGAGHARRSLLAVPAFVSVAAAIIWGAFGTDQGYFWLNASRLDALAAAFASTPAIRSLSLGNDDRGDRGHGFDSYRFVNDVLVTHYPSQARPHQRQPMIHIDDELRALAVPRERYDAMRRLMTQAKVGFAARDPANGQVTINRADFDTQGDLFLLYVPGDGSPGRELADLGSPGRHWFWVRRY